VDSASETSEADQNDQVRDAEQGSEHGAHTKQTPLAHILTVPKTVTRTQAMLRLMTTEMVQLEVRW
jgi:hypothetical protein